MTDSTDLRDQAAKCRRFAADARDSLTAERLLVLASEYDARALLLEQRNFED